MLNGYRVVDVDSHVMEPDDLFDRYLDRAFAAYAPRTRRIAPGWPYFSDVEVLGHRWPAALRWDEIRYLDDGSSYTEAYRDFIERGWDADAYLIYMDRAGIDAMFVYPTLTLHSTAVPNIDPKTAAAVRRAYNDWLYDFCDAANGRIFGVGMLDLRDVDLAIAEANRCVNDLGFRSVAIIPDPPVIGIPLDHAYYDPLWDCIVGLGVPLGTHEAMFHKMGSVGYVAQNHVQNTTIAYAPHAVSFAFGEMMAALSFTGAICARHPELRVVFTESSAGWAATWLPFLDEKWERARSTGYGAPTDQPPSYWFARQCFISGEPGEPGYQYCVEAGLEDNLLVATDFPHPEDEHFPNGLQRAMDLAGPAIGETQLTKMLWDNAAKLYRL
ncbi:MAG: amidohydrolase [Actinobacteria bacterium]|nr:MAG: amidohydrolase [Actinomycetota bacterium]